MPIKYKINVLEELKQAGFTTYKLRKDKIFSESTIQKFRSGEIVSHENIAIICELLHLQPGDILEYASEKA